MERNITTFLIISGFIILLYIAILYFLFTSLSNPHGGWDAYAIWNTNARFIYLGGLQWTNVFNTHIHPDYPLFLPALIAHFWGYMGTNPLIIPILVAGYFMFFTVGILIIGVALVRPINQAFFAGIILISTPLYLYHGTTQFADVALGLYILLSLVTYTFFCLHRNNYQILLITGICAGTAAFTKNEGLLFFVIFSGLIIVYEMLLKNNIGWKQVSNFLYASLPFLLITIIVKIFYAPQNDILNTNLQSRIFLQITDIHRYSTIFNAFTSMLRNLSFTGYPKDTVLLIILYLLIYGSITKKDLKTVLLLGLILLSIIVGYFFIYLISPHDLNWHLSSSLDRLFIQLWPSLIFTYFLLMADNKGKKRDIS